MSKNLTVRKNWVTSFEIMVKNPIILLPFIIIAFFEGLALEFIYFSTRKPLWFLTGPIIRKFSGEAFLHYPFNLIKLPKLFYYFQLVIYILVGVFLTAISINIFKNLKAGLLLKASALIRNATNRYFAFFTYGIIIVVLLFFLKNADMFIFSKFAGLVLKSLPQLATVWLSLVSIAFFFLSNTILYTFVILTIPIIVIDKKSLLKALAGSIVICFRNFFGIFALIFPPLLLYFPIMLLKAFSPNLVNKTFPEITLCIIGVGIIIAAFIDCFIIVCTTQFLLEKDK